MQQRQLTGMGKGGCKKRSLMKVNIELIRIGPYTQQASGNNGGRNELGGRNTPTLPSYM